MNRLVMGKRVAVVAALVEGNSIRATSRMTGVCKPAILKLLADLGPVCAEYHDRIVRSVKSERVQVDEIWQFVGAKAKNTKPEKKAEVSLIRFRGHLLKGSYDVHNGGRHSSPAPAPAVHG